MTASPPPIACRSLLVLGGARSGKSGYALALAEAAAGERLYLATGSAGDAEMAARIARHRSERGEGWTTLEEPLALAEALAREARAARVVLVDCLTFWLANAMFARRDPAEETARLCAAIEALAGPAVFVSNEVGSGIVPETRLGRDFRDEQGRLNQAVARACGGVALVVAGVPIQLKPAPWPRFELR
ncbi:MAG: bifunctional adenosylcobinamide kinase/adenosylcobinamide-phosphate guanylyltransferase [Roseiarcus sp.]|jgi:adenosylcobinamide kinase/adenosylcobinamide-phosphate guanylyltransferase